MPFHCIKCNHELKTRTHVCGIKETINKVEIAGGWSWWRLFPWRGEDPNSI